MHIIETEKLIIDSVSEIDSRSSNLVAHKMAASAGARAKSSSTSTVDEDAVAFAKRVDVYMANSKLFKDTISGAVEAAVGSIRMEVEDLKEEVVKLKSLQDTVTQKAIDNEQYSRRNNIRIFGIPEVQGEDCYERGNSTLCALEKSWIGFTV